MIESGVEKICRIIREINSVMSDLERIMGKSGDLLSLISLGEIDISEDDEGFITHAEEMLDLVLEKER